MLYSGSQRSSLTHKEAIMLYSKNDIIAVAIVYEGHLPIGHQLDPVELAREVLEVARAAGLDAALQLSPHAAVRAKRADENAYYTREDYQPVEELPAMLKECLAEVNRKMIASGEMPGPANIKTLQFKSKSALAGTVWVGLHALNEDMPVAAVPAARAGVGAVTASSTGKADEKPKVPTRMDGSRLWKVLYWIGILVLLMGCMTVALLGLSSGSSTVSDVGGIVGCTAAEFVVGGLLVYLATRPANSKS